MTRYLNGKCVTIWIGRFCLPLGLGLLLCCPVKANERDSLRLLIQGVLAERHATVGVAIIDDSGTDTVGVNMNSHCPMQSVFKMHIALATLAQVDKGLLSLDQLVSVHKSELLPGLWSPLREESPEGGNYTVARLIQFAVSQSDNVACDVLLRIVGGPEKVEEYFHGLGVREISIEINEEEMQSDWDNMYRNWVSPLASTRILKMFYENEDQLLSATSYDFFWKTMKETSTGLNRLKGLLPEGTVVAHKTGSSGTNDDGLTAATNDVGIVFFPDDRYFIISVFVCDSMETDSTNERIIADLARVTYEYYLRR